WNVLFFGGTYLLSLVGSAWVGLLLALVWGAILLAALILRVRTVLQTGLLEAALESAARFGTDDAVGADGDLAFCPACEMPLLPGSAFCAACGTAMRSTFAGHHQPVHAAASIEDSEAAR
ncbi:zinc ribbon domain-containing protein, partial [Stenotrophomonas sp. Ste71]|uniref:zinc ribbon domain-containing protein n=1 Tax=Stenotrophomonas sp. Ste71 TaxID=2926027 RepID=UPI002117850E